MNLQIHNVDQYSGKDYFMIKTFVLQQMLLATSQSPGQDTDGNIHHTNGSSQHDLGRRTVLRHAMLSKI